MKSINVFLLMFFVALSLPVMADNEALSRAQYMVRQMNAELNQLKTVQQNLLTEKTVQEKEFNALQKKYDKLQAKSDKNKKSMNGKVLEIRQQYRDEVGAHTDTRKLLAMKIQEKNKLFNIATEQTQAIDRCVGNNKKLYEINLELLSVYEKKGVWDSVTQAEPFSGLSQVQIENLVDDYQYKLEDLRVEADL